MNDNDCPVRIFCPITNSEETVYFYPKEIEGKWIVHINSFNGCEHNFSGCEECEACKTAAFELIK